MADLSAVKTGDRLKVDCLVTETDLTNRIWCLRVGDDDTVLIEKAALEEAAEHIPAPRVFKRGDWVKEVVDGSSRIPEVRGGFVNYIGGGGKIFVAWPGCAALCTYDSDELEPDEAPE